eukprot:CAMPEP_0172930270 /NCGR_PEP_ID=MMETSP1075-20121228/218903_1 /TAXON_ID=2916 /ORGANISM="Ceratium fusus, Strain PA161109" /LENGTH=482 /DNA_ID=CAMNT_0013791579 /DNA_START=126 /DNA_END=1571 /DNA_ORIENTATION=-
MFSTCGVHAPAPSPSPTPSPPAPPPAAPGRWAVIAAGSAGFFNYRHQADACHAYQIMLKSGIPPENIILMMQDDVATSEENPFKGKLFNKPGDNVTDVYHGCKVDYRGKKVTAKLFLDVITGEESKVPAPGKVLKSGPNDKVFINFVDHGGVGIVAFPNGPLLHASELSMALRTMQKKNMFKELLFYMEACESGSMFPDVTANGKIFAVTASNAKESSWGYYCPKNDTVNGKHMGTCLGDLFSISWMEDSDLAKMSMESIAEQVKRVTKRTFKSHVSTFGDVSFESEPIGNFELAQATKVASPLPDSNAGAVDIRDVPLHLAYAAWERAETKQQKQMAWNRLQTVVAARAADEQLFQKIVNRSCDRAGFGCDYGMIHGKHTIRDFECHRELAATLHESCPRRAHHDAGGWNAFNMKFSQTLVNLCESRTSLQKDLQDLEGIIRAACNDASKSAAGILVVEDVSDACEPHIWLAAAAAAAAAA